jgi:hypothetical protein
MNIQEAGGWKSANPWLTNPRFHRLEIDDTNTTTASRRSGQTRVRQSITTSAKLGSTISAMTANNHPNSKPH